VCDQIPPLLVFIFTLCFLCLRSQWFNCDYTGARAFLVLPADPDEPGVVQLGMVCWEGQHMVYALVAIIVAIPYIVFASTVGVKFSGAFGDVDCLLCLVLVLQV
jgi:hypothetical protein